MVTQMDRYSYGVIVLFSFFLGPVWAGSHSTTKGNLPVTGKSSIDPYNLDQWRPIAVGELNQAIDRIVSSRIDSDVISTIFLALDGLKENFEIKINWRPSNLWEVELNFLNASSGPFRLGDYRTTARGNNLIQALKEATLEQLLRRRDRLLDPKEFHLVYDRPDFERFQKRQASLLLPQDKENLVKIFQQMKPHRYQTSITKNAVPVNPHAPHAEVSSLYETSPGHRRSALNNSMEPNFFHALVLSL